jgi:two-component system sensor histidine kinase KdpD
MSTEPRRPNPDDLLRHIEAETAPRGKLKIFLGYAAGVGKTCAMLEAAQHRLAEGVDVVAGYIEAHQRPETQALTYGLDILPRQKLNYKGVDLEEMDLDGLLARRPQIALVDELAHTNAPGSRHPKRYQDVEELLVAGIDVYTTLNIQHLESLNDVVAQITGVIVRETLPDQILEQADQIELIDLPPEELIKRLQEGKIYLPDRSQYAMQKFFRAGNLTALREMALRKAARRVDEQMTAYMQTRAIAGPWAAGERLLICLSPSPLNPKLIRMGRRLAAELHGEWYAVYVETPGHVDLGPAQQAQLQKNLALARELGARVIILPGDRVAESLVNYAHRQNITKILVGKAIQARWLDLVRPSLVDEIIRQSGQLDVYVISTEEGDSEGLSFELGPRSPWPHYLPVLPLVAGATLINWGLYELLSPTNLLMLYLLVVVVAAVRLGRGPSIMATILGVLAFNFFFVPPRFTFEVEGAQYLLTFLVFLLVGLIIASLTARAREHTLASIKRERQTAALYAFSRDLSAATSTAAISQAIFRHLHEAFEVEGGLFLPTEGRLTLVAASPLFPQDSQEQAVADWAFQNQQAAGQQTETLPAAKGLYLPLRTAQNTLGILGIRFGEGGGIGVEQRPLLEAYATQAALALDSIHLAETTQETQLLQAKEKLQTALLNSISHDLRTPLVSITGALSSLRDQADLLDEEDRRELVAGAWEEANRLNHLLGNLLDMTRIESQAISLKQGPCDLQEIIGVALRQLRLDQQSRPIKIELPPDLAPLEGDFALMVQVLSNLIDNAHKYSPPQHLIEIQAQILDNRELEVQILDRGIGIDPANLARIFDKFYRATTPGIGGTGLGLSICQALIELQGGRIWAENRPGGGSCFKFRMPLAELDA